MEDSMSINMTQLDTAKHTLFDSDGLAVANVKLYPGSNREVTPEILAEQVNNVIAQLLAGDFEELVDDPAE